MDLGYAFTTSDICHQLNSDLGKSDDDFFHIPALPQEHILLQDDQHQDLFKLDTEPPEVLGLKSQALPELPTLGRSDVGQHNLNDGPSSVWTDVWDIDVSNDHKTTSTPKLRTWEAFEKRAVSGVRRTAYLSECGPEVLDAALASQHNVPNEGVLPRDVYFDALRTLMLGRSSIFFQWTESKQTFERTLDKVPTTGLSLSVTNSVTSTFIEYSTLLRRLQASTANARIQWQCAVTQALLNAVSRVLETLEGHVTLSMATCRTVQQLQETLQKPHEVLCLVQGLTEAVSMPTNNEEAVSRLANAVTAVVENGSCWTKLCTKLLEEASRPWLIHLAEEVGLMEPLLQTTSATEEASEQLDIPRPSVAPEHRGDMVLDHEDNRLVSATRDTARILRTHFPGVQLGDMQAASATCFVDAATLDVPTIFAISTLDDAALGTTEEENAWSEDDVQQHYLQTVDQRMSDEPANQIETWTNPLHMTVVEALCGDPSDEATLGVDASTATSPFDRLRPTISAQFHRLNRMLLSHLFEDNKLRDHLNVQYAFQLLGSGEFVNRLSTALFSAETQSAERRRGMVPTAQTMGLRLGARDEKRWPPASSELRLTLLGVLTDTFHGSTTSHSTSERRKADMPGGLNFAIRELPEEEIDKAMDAGSLYALDFLRLQYAAPPPLDAVITPASLQRYDDVFKSLLRLLRVQYVVVHLHTKCQKDDRGGLRFAHAARHSVAALMSHFMDVGISVPWAALQRSLDAAQQALTRKDDEHIPNIHDLRDTHNECLESIRERLFLRRKQAVLRAAVDNVLVAALDSAASHARDPKRLDTHQEFYGSVRHLVKLLRDVVDRPTKARPRETDIEVARLLLDRLDYNGFFSTMSAEKQ